MSKDEKSPENLKQDNSDYKKAHDKWVKEVLEPALAKHPERNKKEFIGAQITAYVWRNTKLANVNTRDGRSEISQST